MGLSASTPIPVTTADYDTHDLNDQNGVDATNPATILSSILADGDENDVSHDEHESPSRFITASRDATATTAAESSAISSPPQSRPVDWKKAFAAMSDEELQEVILSSPVSEKDIRAKALSQRGTRTSLPSTNSSSSSLSSSVVPTLSKGGTRMDPAVDLHSGDTDHHDATTFYITSGGQRNGVRGGNKNSNDEDITDLCFRILRISPAMAKMRFKLVPNKMKEHVFWRALLTILHDTTVAKRTTEPSIDGDGGNQASAGTAITGSPVKFAAAVTPPRQKTPTQMDSASRSPASDDTNNYNEKIIFKLRRKIEKQEWTIESLRQEIHSLKEEKQHQQGASTSTTTGSYLPASSPVCNNVKKHEQIHQHAGEWIMDQDSIDFLTYPQELKENLRMEKWKRLEEVKAQMRFILDSDDIQDSNGHWSCCGQTEYNSKPAPGDGRKCTVAKKK